MLYSQKNNDETKTGCLKILDVRLRQKFEFKIENKNLGN